MSDVQVEPLPDRKSSLFSQFLIPFNISLGYGLNSFWLFNVLQVQSAPNRPVYASIAKPVVSLMAVMDEELAIKLAKEEHYQERADYYETMEDLPDEEEGGEYHDEEEDDDLKLALKLSEEEAKANKNNNNNSNSNDSNSNKKASVVDVNEEVAHNDFL